MANLDLLLPELLSSIVINLDPISVISLSQTSRYLRLFISPSHFHFAQRLLALELLPEHGGGVVPLFRGRDNRLTPPFEHQSWKNAKYACCGCMRLRHHMWFGNHSILGLGLRKPPPDSVEATRLTDWVPDSDGMATRRILHARRQAEAESRATARMQYHRASTGVYLSASLAVDDMGPIDKRAEQAEKLICGVDRIKRRCLECRFNRGDWNRTTADSYGTPESPLVISRKVGFLDLFERCFPGFSPQLPQDQLPTLFRVMGTSKKHEKTTLHVARCFLCHQWQEMAAFRIFPTYNHFRPSEQFTPGTPPACNACEFKCIGDKDFAEKVSDGAMKVATACLSSIQERAELGWRHLTYDYFELETGFHKHLRAMTQLLRSVEMLPKVTFFSGLVAGDEERKEREKKAVADFRLSEDILRANQERVVEVRKYLTENLTDGEYANLVSSWFELWLNEYERNAAAYNRMSKIIITIRDSPEKLVNYLLHEAPYRI
ncbi:hypothetical protein OQA88_2431 [Cercophora sp. LCS_1]